MAQTAILYEGDGLFWSARPNRSLSARGRRVWVGLIAANAILMSAMAVVIGAWPILPFAGLEVLLVVVAFALVERHDNDFERLEVVQDKFRWEARNGNNCSSLTGNVAWMRIEWCVIGNAGRRYLRLSYAGQSVLVGACLTEHDLTSLAAGLAKMPTLAGCLKQAGSKA